MKKILITGVNGFVGKYLLHYLSANNADDFYFLGTCRNKNTKLSTSYQVDLCDECDTQVFIDGFEGDIYAIIHLASVTAHADDLSSLKVIKDNVSIAENISKIAIEKNVKQFINLSSSSVYDNSSGSHSENSPIAPAVNSDALYGLSKFNVEVIIDYFLSNRDVCITHLRAAMIYGEGMNQTRIIPVIEKSLIENNEAILYGNGERMVNLIHIKSLSLYIEFLLATPYQGIFNVSEEYKSTLQITEELAQTNNISDPVIHLEEAGSRANFYLDSSKLKKIFNKRKL